MHRTLRASLLTALLAGSAASGLPAQATISTEAQAVGTFGTTANTVGQTFSVPDANNNVLQSFRLGFETSYTPEQYVARLMAWNPGSLQLAGAPLFQSAVGTTTGLVPWRYVTFDVGGIALDPTATYIFFLSFAAGSGPDFAASTLTPPTDPYPGGSAYLVGDNMFDSVDTGTQWTQAFRPLGGLDLGFTAQFTPDATVTPEPASMALVGTGLAALVGARRRRRRQAAEADG